MEMETLVCNNFPVKIDGGIGPGMPEIPDLRSLGCG